MTLTRKQHQVPQFLLRNFAFNDGKQLHALDKSTGHEFAVSVKDAAAQNGFYNFALPNDSISIESHLGKLETAASTAISKLTDTETLECLTDDDRCWVSLFVCVQLARSPNWRLMQQDLTKQFVAHAEALGAPPDRDLHGVALDAALALQSIADANRWVPLILQKTWALARASERDNLLVSDSPLTLHNYRQFGPYGNLGLAVPGIQIQLPLSNKLSLWMICPTLHAEFESAAQALGDPEIARKARTALDELSAMLESMRLGQPITLTPDNVTFFNHLQVRFAARFVYSHDGDFSLVRRMLRDNEGYRRGTRFKF